MVPVRLAIVAALFVSLLGAAVGSPGRAGAARAESASILSASALPQRCFTETLKCLSGPFLDYWNLHGALPINGFPLTDPFLERLDDGKSYLVQYCERVRLEYHPENSAPYDVLLGQFGRALHPADPPAARQTGSTYFTETAHNLRGPFRDYWERTGDLAQFGYPLSEEITETLEDGKPYTVQYFERARFELHPENPAPFTILLGQFGRRILASRIGDKARIGGSLYYLADDGATIRRQTAGGTSTVFTIALQPGDEVIGLSVAPGGGALVYRVASPRRGNNYLATLVRNGAATPLPDLASTPIWSPDGTRFLAEQFDPQVPGRLYLHTLATAKGETLAQRGRADWFADGQRLVYTDSRNIYTLATSGGTPTRLTNLPQDQDNGWYLQEAHVTPDGARIVFFGGQFKNLGASGNGMQWWSIPVAGGQPTAWTEFGGNGILDYAATAATGRIAYAEGFHVSACASGQVIDITDGARLAPVLTVVNTALDGSSPEHYLLVQGLSWSPGGWQLAFGASSYDCGANGPTFNPPGIYLWDPVTTGQRTIRKVADGRYPSWIP